MSENQSNNTQVAADLGAALSAVKTVGTTPFVAIPEGYNVENLEFMLDRPTRKRGKTTLRDTKSFIALVIQEATKESRIYGCYQPPGFKAVFNDHSLEGPNWRDYIAEFNCPLSVEWKVWTAADGKQFPQSEFAEFIENNLPDIAQPPAADMLEISRTLEAKKKVNFASGVRLSNGETELTYEEQISGTASKGKITVPETFTIGVPVMEGGPKYAVQCRLRYRIGDGGKMAMWYELVRPHKIVEDAINEVWEMIQNATGVSVLNGSI